MLKWEFQEKSPAERDFFAAPRMVARLGSQVSQSGPVAQAQTSAIVSHGTAQAAGSADEQADAHLSREIVSRRPRTTQSRLLTGSAFT
jgi:hypothetical protein